MALPTRPVSGATIASVWGQAVHDWVFAASGGAFHGLTRTVGTSPLRVGLTVADSDPGGYLDAANNRVEIPTDKQGLYFVSLVGNTVSGDVGDKTRFFIYLNGSQIATGQADNSGATNVPVALTFLYPFVATDLIEVYAQKIGAGTTPTVKVNGLQLLRLTDAYGA